GAGAGAVVGLRQHTLDTDVPSWFQVRRLAEPKVRIFLNGLEPVRLLQGTANPDRKRLALFGAREIDGHQPRLPMVAVRVDDQVRDAPLCRIYDDVRELPEGPVRAVHGATEFQTQD